MSRRPFRLPAGEPPFLKVATLGRSGPLGSTRFSPAQIDPIRRTVRRTPEVMVKVTGGGKNTGAVAANFAYISRKGKLEIETDEGERIGGTDARRTFLATWHLELSAGQYRGPVTSVLAPGKPSWSTKLCCGCRRRPHRRRCSPQPARSPERSSGSGIAMPWWPVGVGGRVGKERETSPDCPGPDSQ